MSRFGDSANGPSVLDISNISGVSADIDTLADHATAISNLGPVATEISNLGTTAVIADMSALGTQAVRDDMDALADVTTELGVLGNTTTAGYIAAIGTSTVGATSQLTVDALGQLTSEISLLASNIQTLQNSASNSPIQIGNLSDVDFTSNSPSLGDTIVFTSNNKFEAQALPGAGPLSGTNLTVTNPQLNQILKISAVNAGIPEYVNTTVSALVYSADFDNLTEVAAATPAAAGEVVHYDGTSAWTVGQLDYSEITGTPSLHAVATSGASTDLSDTADLVYQSSGTINGDYVINGNLDIATNYELRVDTIDPYPDGAGATPGTLTILGNLQVDGTTTTINTQDLLVTDSTIVVAKDATSASAANGAGFEIGNYASNPAFLYDGSAADKFTLNRDLDVGTNQLYFSNVFSTSSDLPAAGSYHGMFAHVHADAAAYYAHNGNWVKLANDADVVKPNDSVTLGNVEANNVIVDAGASDAAVEIGKGRSADGNAYFDLIGVGAGLYPNDPDHEDYGFRVLRGGGLNPTSQVNHKGTGELRFTTEDGGAMRFSTSGTTAMLLHGNQKVQMPDYGVNGNVGTAAYSLAVDANGFIIEEQDVSSTALPEFGSVTATRSNYPACVVRETGQLGEGQLAASGAEVQVRNTGNSGGLAFFTNNLRRATIDVTGNLGIGTQTPDTLVEMVGADPVLTIRDSETGIANSSATLRLAETGAGDALDEYWDTQLYQGAYRVTYSGSARLTIDRTSGEVQTLNSGNMVSLRKADVRTNTGTHTLVGGASLYYANAAATYNTASLQPGDIVTIYNEGGGTVTVDTGGTVSLFKDGEASAVTAAVTIGADTIATVTCVSATKAIISGSDLT